MVAHVCKQAEGVNMTVYVCGYVVTASLVWNADWSDGGFYVAVKVKLILGEMRSLGEMQCK